MVWLLFLYKAGINSLKMNVNSSFPVRSVSPVRMLSDFRRILKRWKNEQQAQMKAFEDIRNAKEW